MNQKNAGYQESHAEALPLTTELRARLPVNLKWCHRTNSDVIHPMFTEPPLPTRPLCAARGRWVMVLELLENPAVCPKCFELMNRIGKVKGE